MKKILLATLLALSGTVAEAEQFQVDPTAARLNVRNGPGTYHPIVGVLPPGALVTAMRCVPRDDGIKGPDWCLISYGALSGWASRISLLPMAPTPAPPVAAPPAELPVNEEAKQKQELALHLQTLKQKFEAATDHLDLICVGVKGGTLRFSISESAAAAKIDNNFMDVEVFDEDTIRMTDPTAVSIFRFPWTTDRNTGVLTVFKDSLNCEKAENVEKKF